MCPVPREHSAFDMWHDGEVTAIVRAEGGNGEVGIVGITWILTVGKRGCDVVVILVFELEAAFPCASHTPNCAPSQVESITELFFGIEMLTKDDSNLPEPLWCILGCCAMGISR